MYAIAAVDNRLSRRTDTISGQELSIPEELRQPRNTNFHPDSGATAAAAVGNCPRNLQEIKQRLQLALSAANEGFWEWDAATGDCYYAPRFNEILGYAPEALAGRYETWLTLIHPEDLPLAIRQRTEQMAGQEGSFLTEYRLRARDGGYIWVQSRGRVITRTPDGNPERIVGTITDITERRKLEEQFHQAQRMESIGRLAGGVAHDFNNLLTVINGYAEMAVADLAPDNPVYQSILQIQAAGGKAAVLTRQLLDFSRKQVLQNSVLDLNQVVADVSKLLRRLIGDNVTLTELLAGNLGNVIADSGQIEQIIVNLAVNGRDAMPNGGTLIIATSNIDLGDSSFQGHSNVPAGNYVMLTMTDDGSGMSPEVQARAFEPFFTTKPKGLGTGQGLATVYGIVKQMGAWIRVYSQPGCGTTFRIYFPRTEAAIPRPGRLIRSNLEGTESILVVEDEVEVRGLAVAALQRYGYTVHSVADAQEAIEFARGHERPLHLVITDMVMPGLSGRELARELSRDRPELPVLFMSGYSDVAMTDQGIIDDGSEYIQKPFTPEELAQRVRELLPPETMQFQNSARF